MNASSNSAAPATLLRQRGGHDSGRVGMVELFFDLVFVFAVTQLSHGLLHELSLANALKIALLMLAVWWVWIYTSWVTNWLDPERQPVRIALFALMLAGLVLSSSIPKAFGERGLAFAAAYVVMQVGRTLFFLWAVRHERIALRRNFQRILVWLLASAACWIVGGLADGESRLAWWALGLALEFVGPWAYFRVPGLGASQLEDWDVDGGHMAERCGLFIIIALGESLLVSGATFAEQPWTATTAAAFGSSFLGTVAMWWLYFDRGAETAHHHIVHADDPGRDARVVYTYLHLLIVAGVIVCAVADELVLAHPDHADTAAIAAIIGGPALYLLGTASFKWATHTRRLPPLSHLVGLLLLALLAWPAMAHLLSALASSALTTAVLVVVAAWEVLALRRTRRRTQAQRVPARRTGPSDIRLPAGTLARPAGPAPAPHRIRCGSRRPPAWSAAPR